MSKAKGINVTTNDDRPDVKQANPSSKEDIERVAKAFADAGVTMSEAIGKAVNALRKAVTPKFILVVLKHNYQMTPKWRFIRRYQLRQKIAEVEALVELDAITYSPKADNAKG